MHQLQAPVEADAGPVPAPADHKHRISTRAYGLLAMLAMLTIVAAVLMPHTAKRISPAPEEYIEQQARSFGTRTFERLTAADNLLRLIGADLELHGTVTETSQSVTPDAFSSVALLHGVDAPVMIKGPQPGPLRPGDEAVSHIANGQTALITGSGSMGTRLTLLRAVSLVGVEQPVLLLAELADGYLWRSSESTNSSLEICVRDSAGERVFCQAPAQPPAAEDAKRRRASAQLEQMPGRSAPGERLTGQSRIALGQQFGTGDWLVSISQPRPAINGAARFAPIGYMVAGMMCVFISMLLVSLLTRRKASAGPTEGSLPPIASGKVSLLPVRTKDAGTNTNWPLGTERTSDAVLSALRLFSEIDRAILSGATFERIIESVFPHIRAALPGDAAAVALLDHERPTHCRMIIVGPQQFRKNFLIEDALDAPSTNRLASMPDGDWLDSTPDDALLAPLYKLGLKRCLLIPLFKDGVAAGMLIVANTDVRSLSIQAQTLARDIAHRLGVAYTSAVRGQELLFHSLYDSITELPNRKFFENRLEEEISRARRESRRLALLLVDLDDFKKVNDNFGHEGGDMLLEQASVRLKTCLRTEDLVARVGSDEFSVLLPTISGGTDAAQVAEKLIETLAEPYVLGGREHHLSATIGVAVFPEDGRSPQALLRSADFAMHAGKRDGGATYLTYEAQSNEQAKDQAALAHDLRQALAKSELTLYFQPQIDLRRGEIVGAEALVRWHHHTRGMVMPGAFISIAEQSDLIEQVGEFVRREASAQFRAWEQDGTAPLRVSVNVSSREFKRKDFVERIENTLIMSGMRPFSLELEITESLLVEHSDHVLESLKALSDRGVRIAIDDFGTGYSSMAYLKNIPFHVLKIDRSFVKDIGTQDGSDSIVNAIIGVAQGLGKEIVAEGIEIEAHRAFLADNGCDMGQGYLWSRPVPADEFAAFVRNWNETARRVAAIE